MSCPKTMIGYSFYMLSNAVKGTILTYSSKTCNHENLFLLKASITSVIFYSNSCCKMATENVFSYFHGSTTSQPDQCYIIMFQSVSCILSGVVWFTEHISRLCHVSCDLAAFDDVSTLRRHISHCSLSTLVISDSFCSR